MISCLSTLFVGRVCFVIVNLYAQFGNKYLCSSCVRERERKRERETDRERERERERESLDSIPKGFFSTESIQKNQLWFVSFLQHF